MGLIKDRNGMDLAIYLGPNYGGGNEDNGDFLQRSVEWLHYYMIT